MIVANPPSKSAAQFAAHALLRVMLLRPTFRECARRNADPGRWPAGTGPCFSKPTPNARDGARGTAFQIRRQVDHRLFKHFRHRQQRVRLASQAEIEQQEIVDGTANGAAPGAGCWRLRAASLQVSASEPLRPGRHRDRCGRAQRACCLRASSSPRIWEIEEQAHAELQS